MRPLLDKIKINKIIPCSKTQTNPLSKSEKQLESEAEQQCSYIQLTALGCSSAPFTRERVGQENKALRWLGVVTEHLGADTGITL